QPQPFPQNSSQSAAITQPSSQPGSQPKLGPPQQGAQPPHQPAARPVAIPNTSHDGHWPRTVAPNSLVNSGAVGNSEPGFRGLTPPIPWEHAPRPHFPLVPASWPYGLHQNFMHQGNARFQPNKPFYTQDRCATRRCRERCPHPPRGNVSE
ncbi:ZCCHC11 isoform 7, partial [Pongo abelii]